MQKVEKEKSEVSDHVKRTIIRNFNRQYGRNAKVSETNVFLTIETHTNSEGKIRHIFRYDLEQKPTCSSGKKCYRKNKSHFEKYKH